MIGPAWRFLAFLWKRRPFLILGILGASAGASEAAAEAPGAVAGDPAHLSQQRSALQARMARAGEFLASGDYVSLSIGPAPPGSAASGERDGRLAQFPNWPNYFRNFPNFPNYFSNFPNFPNFPNFNNFLNR